MENYCLYTFFDNSSIAALIAVAVGYVLASKQYQSQKSLDRLATEKQKIVDLISEIYQATDEVVFIYDRATMTLLSADSDTEKNNRNNQDINQKQLEYLEIIGKNEVPRISDLINEKIPILQKKINSYAEIFFSNSKRLDIPLKQFNLELDNWHSSVFNGMGNSPMNFKVKSEKIENLQLNKFKDATNTLIKEISQLG